MNKIAIISAGITLAVSIALTPSPKTARINSTNNQNSFLNEQILITNVNEVSILKNSLLQKGISKEKLDDIFSDERLEYLPRIKELLNKNPEKNLTYKEYKKRLLSTKRILSGKLFIIKNRNLLEKVKTETRVSIYDIVAILGIETTYGRKKSLGQFNAFNALYSRYLDFPEKREWVAEEIAHLIKLAEENNLDIFEINGSYCGCIGIGQFLPSSWNNYFVDGNKDGQKDPFNLEDAVYSIANYLKHAGYDAENNEKRYKAIYEYNHSDMYVKVILALSDKLKKIDEAKHI